MNFGSCFYFVFAVNEVELQDQLNLILSNNFAQDVSPNVTDEVIISVPVTESELVLSGNANDEARILEPVELLEDKVTNSSLIHSPVPHSSSNGDTNDNSSRKRAKKNKANPENWLQKKNQLYRQKGLPYKGLIKSESSDGEKKWNYGAQKSQRELRPRCNCRNSEINSKIKCGEFSSHDRESIFKNFWDLSWAEKKVTVKLLTQLSAPKDKKTKRT